VIANGSGARQQDTFSRARRQDIFRAVNDRIREMSRSEGAFGRQGDVPCGFLCECVRPKCRAF